MNTLNRLGIVGLGLLGSSLAATVRLRDSKIKIYGVSSPDSLSYATKNNLIDFSFSYEEIDTVLKQCDILVLCTPINHILQVLDNWKQQPLKTNHHCLVLDVGSTKEIICKKAEESFKQAPNIIFIGSHPMTGSENSGVKSCDPILYENATWILSPNKKTSSNSLKKANAFIRFVGAYPFQILPKLHDQLVAQFSHIPQLIATGLAHSISQKPTEMLKGLSIAGEGFNSMTRLAQSPYHIWKDIFDTNTHNIEEYLENIIQTLIYLKKNIQHKNLEKVFKISQNLRKQYIQDNQTFNAYNGEIIVNIKDKPGSLQLILSYLEQNNLNIMNIHILKIKEQEPGNLLISFKYKQEAKKAYDILNSKDYATHLR